MASKENRKDKNLIVLKTFYRKNLGNFLIAILTFVALIFVSNFFAEPLIENFATCRRIKKADCNQIAFSYVKYEDECFLNFNGSMLMVNQNSLRIDADILMAYSNYNYQNNVLEFKGNLNDGECAISGNLLKENNLKIGDKISVSGSDVSFTISKILPSQSGIDKNYLHKGIIVLSENSKLMDRKFVYVSFLKDAEQYISLKEIIFLEDTYKESSQKAIKNLAYILICYVVFIWMVDLLFCKRKKKDYSILAFDGLGRSRLYLAVFGDNLLKFLIPALIVGVIYYLKFIYYGLPALIFSLVISLLVLINILVLSLINYRRAIK